MENGLRTTIPPRQVAEILGILALVLWRMAACPLRDLWRDWVTLLAVYWFLSIVLTGKRAWLPVTLGYGLGMMVLYLWGQMPHTVAVLRMVQ